MRAVLAAALAALAAPALASDPAPVIAAERAFAKDGAATGIKASFLKWSAPEGIVFAPGPRLTRDVYGSQPDPKPGEKGPAPAWWPLWAGISASGDLGFTTGPVEWDGERAGYHYFTVWKRQADGSWRWVYDGGGGGDGAGLPGPETEPATLQPTGARSASAAAAFAEVRSAEAALADISARDHRAALQSAIPPDGRVHVPGRPPAVDQGSVVAALGTRPAAVRFDPTAGGEASAAGDLAWTYGRGTWTQGGSARVGWYVRVWQKRADGWRVVYDQLLPEPLPKPPTGWATVRRRRTAPGSAPRPTRRSAPPSTRRNRRRLAGPSARWCGGGRSPRLRA